MALIVEDGTGIATADSFCSVEYANIYHANRGNAAWALLDEVNQKEPALRKATDYIGSVYRNRWQGSRVYPLIQALDWPRKGVVVDEVSVLSTIVPQKIKRACAELALRASAGDLQADLTQGVLQETVGPISITYDKSSPQQIRYAAVEALLAPFLKFGGGINVGLVRS
ncbi:MAG: hypothetical protein QMD11_07940 [Smithella sp.]|nr:hypothetical protein [Smithella sp.]